MQVSLTQRARLFETSAANYSNQVKAFYSVCRAAGVDESFTFDSICLFCEWYVAGCGDRKLRAHTTLAQYFSAWSDHCLEHDLPFAYPGTVLRKRVNKFVKGLENRFPHKKRVTVPLCLDALSAIAIDYGFASVGDLYRRPVRMLSRWARIIAAHDAFLRPIEHSGGCRLSDFDDHGSFATLLVGSRKKEAKYKRRPRVCVLPVQPSHLSAGFVLRVLVQRLHAAVAPSDRGSRILFSDVSAGPLPEYTGAPESWRTAFKRLQAFAAAAGLVVATGSCLRAGGATDFFARGAPRWWIKRQGGWRGDAVDRYNQPTAKQRHAVTAAISADILRAAIRNTPRRPRS